MAVKPLSVAQLNRYIGQLVGRDPLLTDLLVKGEISGLKDHHSGHTYFSLKDQHSIIRCFLHSKDSHKLRYPLEEGMEVIVSGFITTYEKGGTYSIWVKDVIVEGEGQLAVAFEKLKERLRAEGLFDSENKKALPFFPEKIGIITAKGGAAIEDMLKIIRGKNSVVDILFYPTLVQGEKAAVQMARGMDFLNRNYPELDLIIIGRGGGSAEDLWAFNEEVLARAIYRSSIPVISAVGHETDVTIADFVADCRGETPTAAAEMAVPHISTLKDHLKKEKRQLEEKMQGMVQEKEKQVHRYRMNVFYQSIEDRLIAHKEKITYEKDRINESIWNRWNQSKKWVELGQTVIQEANPKAIMKRSYGFLQTAVGKPIKTTEQVRIGDRIRVTLSDGHLEAKVERVRRNHE